MVEEGVGECDDEDEGDEEVVVEAGELLLLKEENLSWATSAILAGVQRLLTTSSASASASGPRISSVPSEVHFPFLFVFRCSR